MSRRRPRTLRQVMAAALFVTPLALGLGLGHANPAHAQAPAANATCGCTAYPGPHYHVGAPAQNAGHGLFGALRGRPGSRPSWLYGAPGDGYDPIIGGNPNTLPGLPRGRRYYGGRYFGSFNNRFYGPQYGYF